MTDSNAHYTLGICGWAASALILWHIGATPFQWAMTIIIAIMGVCVGHLLVGGRNG